jgi:hypothetical protein
VQPKGGYTPVVMAQPLNDSSLQASGFASVSDSFTQLAEAKECNVFN